MFAEQVEISALRGLKPPEAGSPIFEFRSWFKDFFGSDPTKFQIEKWRYHSVKKMLAQEDLTLFPTCINLGWRSSEITKGFCRYKVELHPDLYICKKN